MKVERQIITKKLTFAEITIDIQPVGEDILIKINGGDKPHIGSVVLAIPRPSLNSSNISCTSSVLNVIGHKDEFICRNLAENFCKKFNAVTVCTGGFHVDNLAAAQIQEVIDACDIKNFGGINMEKTLVLIKPDAFGKNHTGDILKRYEDEGFKIVAAKVMQMDKKLAAIHYAEHIGKPFYPELVDFMTSAPLMALVIGGDNVIQRVRDINGATNPSKAADGTIRKLYAENVTKNAVHASDSPESAAREIPIFFSEIEQFGA